MMKGFNFSIKAVLILAIGLVAALTVIAFVNDGASTFINFSNTSMAAGGFIE